MLQITGGLPKIRATFQGLPGIRIVVFGVYTGVPLSWETTISCNLHRDWPPKSPKPQTLITTSASCQTKRQPQASHKMRLLYYYAGLEALCNFKAMLRYAPWTPPTRPVILLGPLLELQAILAMCSYESPHLPTLHNTWA